MEFLEGIMSLVSFLEPGLFFTTLNLGFGCVCSTEFRKKNAGKKKTVDENKKRKLEEEASAEKTKSNHKDKSPEEEIVADND